MLTVSALTAAPLLTGAGPAAANGPCGNLGAVESDETKPTEITCAYDDFTAPTHFNAPAGIAAVVVLLVVGSGGTGAGTAAAPGAAGTAGRIVRSTAPSGRHWGRG